MLSTHLIRRFNTNMLKTARWEKIYRANSNHKKAGEAMLILSMLYFPDLTSQKHH